MLSQEENALLTQTNSGTPGGTLLRSYWQPVGLSYEIEAGGSPVPVRILGEDLVLFRDDDDRPGLLGLHCSHRAADLSYGRCENGGLRCLYHGWLFDVAGNCLEQPGEPVNSGFKGKVHHTAYPCEERAGIVLAYLGSGDPPLVPNYPFLEAADGYTGASKVFHECNYLQGNEGNIDSQHLSFLHRFFEAPAGNATLPGSSVSANALYAQQTAPTIEVEKTNFGLSITAIRPTKEGRGYVRVSNFIMPNIATFPAGVPVDEGYGVHWHVPIDDEHHWKFWIVYNKTLPIDEHAIQRMEGVPEDFDTPYHLRRTKSNRYLQSRDEMQTKTFIGMGENFSVHDKFAVEGEGVIQDRTTEHLGYSDKAIIAARQLLLTAIKGLEDGATPLHVIRDTEANNLSHIGAFGYLQDQT